MKHQITKLGFLQWQWVVYPDPNVCRNTDPHGVAPFKWLAKWQVRRAIALQRKLGYRGDQE